MTPVLLREHKESFGPYLRGLREARALTLRVASARLGITFAKLQKMETGGETAQKYPTGEPASGKKFAQRDALAAPADAIYSSTSSTSSRLNARFM